MAAADDDDVAIVSRTVINVHVALSMNVTVDLQAVSLPSIIVRSCYHGQRHILVLA